MDLAGSKWFRQHNDRPSDADRGAWYFASHAPDEIGAGRFDLTGPEGTCYLADTEMAAVHECIGHDMAASGWVPADLVEGRVLSKLPLPHDVRSADTTVEEAANFRVTNEIHTTGDYGTAQAWARAFHDSGFGGVFYELRFANGFPRGLALFGPQGAPSVKPVGDAAPQNLREFVEAQSIEVVDAPSVGAVRLVDPPTA